MLYTIETKLKYYETVINGLMDTIRITKEARNKDISYFVNKYVESIDLSWVKPETIYKDHGYEKTPYRILVHNGKTILEYNVYTLADFCISEQYRCLTYDVAIALNLPMTENKFNNLGDKILAYSIVKKYLQYDDDIVEFLYDLNV